MTPFETLAMLVGSYQVCHHYAFDSARHVACDIEALVWDLVGLELFSIYDLLFDFENSTATRLIFHIKDTPHRFSGTGNIPPPLDIRVIVTDGEVNLYGEMSGLDTSTFINPFKEVMFT